MKFCIIGAGNGGRAFAAYLASKGQIVNLYNRSFLRIAHICKKGGIRALGEINGFFPLNLITQDLKKAVSNVDVILIVTPASAHKFLAREITPYLSNDQIILLNPGRTFGAIEFYKTITNLRPNLRIFVAETQTLLFTSRQLKKHKVNIIKIKNSVEFAAFPEENTQYVYLKLKKIFPQLKPSDDYLSMTLTNIGMLLHPAITILNAGAMDGGRPFKFYKEGATPNVCQVLEAIQLEINTIFDKLGVKQYDFCKWANLSYGVNFPGIFETIQNIKPYEGIYAPKQLITRYLTEDVPTGLVPLKSLADFLGVKVPIIESIICISSILCGIDFEKTGRTLENLEIVDYIKERTFIREIYETQSLERFYIDA
ncbi:MAG: NAD/NADP octopine/nopaline dehydrogenase family protein [Promethearchaeota archaeon]